MYGLKPACQLFSKVERVILKKELGATIFHVELLRFCLFIYLLFGKVKTETVTFMVIGNVFTSLLLFIKKLI